MAVSVASDVRTNVWHVIIFCYFMSHPLLFIGKE